MPAVKIQFPKGVEVDEAFVRWAEHALSAAGISQAQADALVPQWQTYVTDRTRTETLQAQAHADREVERLRNVGGKDWDANIAAGKKAVKALGLSNAELDALERAVGLGPVVSLFARLGRNVTSTGDAAQANRINIPTPEEGARTVEQLKGDANFQRVLRDRRDPGHQEALRQWEAAFATAHPAPETPAAPTSTPSSTPAAPASGGTRRSLEALRSDANFQATLRDLKSPQRPAALEEWVAANAETPKPT
jgi:hypothetical protein